MARLTDLSGVTRFEGAIEYDPAEAPILQGGPLTVDLVLGTANGNGLPGKLPAADAASTGGVSALLGGPGVGGTDGGAAVLRGGDSGNGNSGAAVQAGGGTQAARGIVQVTTANSQGASGEALVSDGAAGLKYGGVQIAAGVPMGAPSGLPVAVDTTAVSGGVYVWSGAAWVKAASI